MTDPFPLRLRRALMLLVAFSALSGCAALSAVSDAATPLDVYEIPAPSGIEPRARTAPRDVIVETPTTSGALETDRIMIRPNPLQAQYLPGARWGEETPVMLQTLMLRAIEATGAVRYVGRRPLGPSGDYAIITELTDFQAEQVGEGARVDIAFLSRIVRERDAAIIASRTFRGQAVTPSTDTLPVVQAFEAASDQALTNFALWVRDIVS
ncbi:ABC-type transport auxiliary lipoprotein family protein [Marivita sp. GX14005]|uniref:ABC-type transport auxiliary lipoprotein family protein n=1 Tax=Marivita sp. GX14005 TaxID=2942276 RepID=UPI0020195E5C|nr:ABC-type transport auxiliary lipoprotein family protein [Marivita sp. GX14005]MCL3881189.1 ABC-type transport auxiliary lipoprotein family protein [Marivita sp. GX14005]